MEEKKEKIKEALRQIDLTKLNIAEIHKEMEALTNLFIKLSAEEDKEEKKLNNLTKIVMAEYAREYEN